MPKRRRYSFRKRHFLEPLPSRHNSYISGIVDFSHSGTEPHGENVLVLADCYRLVEIEFYLGSPEARKLSLYKIDKMAQTITQFRDALHKESELIEKSRKGRAK